MARSILDQKLICVGPILFRAVIEPMSWTTRREANTLIKQLSVDATYLQERGNHLDELILFLFDWLIGIHCSQDLSSFEFVPRPFRVQPERHELKAGGLGPRIGWCFCSYIRLSAGLIEIQGLPAWLVVQSIR